jgi:hypothetical protein
MLPLPLFLRYMKTWPTVHNLYNGQIAQADETRMAHAMGE